MKSKTLKSTTSVPPTVVKLVSAKRTFSDMLRSARRGSAYAFFASLGIWLPRSDAATLIDLDATTGYPGGPLNTWTNKGTVVGDFVVPVGSAVPAATNKAGVACIQFLAAGGAAGTSYLGPVAPANVCSNSVRSFEAWIWDTARYQGNTVLAWGRRGVNGLNESLGHGVDVFSMAGHFGPFDFSYGAPETHHSNVVVAAWTYIAYTYDGTNCTVYVDGKFANRQAVGTLNTASVASDNVTPLSFRVARQNAAAGTLSGADVGDFFAARIRVKDTVMTAADILAQYNAEKVALAADTDADGMPDWFEARYGVSAPGGDADGDGATNLEEYTAGSNPTVADTDGDGISDGAELHRTASGQPAPTDPTKADTDGDGLSDAVETNTGVFVSAADTGTNPLSPDGDGDTYSDGVEVGKSTNPFSAASHPNPVVSLDATGLAFGSLSTWTNLGTLPGNFTSVSATNQPAVTNFDGVTGVRFTTLGGGGANGTSYYGPRVPEGLTGAGARTVDAWVYNPARVDEKTFLAWGARDFSPNTGANVSFGEGGNLAYGAVAQWGGPDIGWFNEAVYGRWHHIAYTYDGTTTRIYLDGDLISAEALALVTAAIAPADGLPYHFRIARQNDGNNTNPAGSATSGEATGGATGIDGTGAGEFTMAKIRVHDFAEDRVSILARFNSEKATFTLQDSDVDGLPDWWEVRNGLNPNNSTGVNGAGGDPDGDGLTNLQEFQLGTHMFPSGTRANLADTDADGASDFAEVNRFDRVGGVLTTNAAPTNPLVRDTDGDSLRDGAETDTGVYVSVNDTGTDPLKGDSDGDGYADGLEVAQGSDPNNAASIPSPLPIVSLDATTTNSPVGVLNAWTNTGRLGGTFVAEQGGGSANVGGTIEAIQGVQGLTLNGGSYRGTNATFVTGNPNYSVEAWVYNPAIGDEETIIGWGRRGGGDGTMSAFTDGSNGTWGAMTHWGAPDLTWNGANIRTPPRWKYLVYTYDAALQTQIVYSDGVEANREVLGSPLIIADSLDGGLTHLPFRVGNETAGDGNPGGFAGTMTMGEIRVYTRVLPPSEITSNFNSGAAKYGIVLDVDGLPIWWKRVYGFPVGIDVSNGDPDNDGLTNLQEYNGNLNGTNPLNPDSDGDGLNDGQEFNVLATNPNNPDTDWDGLTDAREVALATNPAVADSDGDGFPDSTEVLYGSNPNDIASLPDVSTPRPFVNLDAIGFSTGPLSIWTNNSPLGWTFNAPTGAVANVEVVNGTKGVVFNGTNWYTSRATPQFFAGNASRTVEAWIFNPTLSNEETLFSWGRRGGPDGTGSAFIHGTDGGFGAIGFWGAPDVSWGTNGTQIAANVVAGQWTFVSYTYDAATTNAIVYKDGVQANSEAFAAPLNTHFFDPSDLLNSQNPPVGRALPFMVGGQNEANGSRSAVSASTMTIAKIRAYDVALSAAQIAAHYNAERVQFPGQFKITNVRVNPANGFVSFDWVPAPGKTYEVQRNSNVTNPSGWAPIATGQNSGSFTDNPAGASINYYRLRQE